MDRAMKTEATNSDQVLEALAEVRRELARLGARVAALEATAGLKAVDRAGGASPPTPPPAPAAAAPPVQAEDLSEEIILVLSAAVAAFLGKKAPIRQIHLVGTAAWAQQGRVSIQASHALQAHHSRSHS
jgi:methylmalonyl-CoA carboxyltransferase large subunit